MGDISRNFSYEEFKVSISYPQVAAAIELTQLDKLKFFWLTHLFLQPIRDAVNNGIAEEIPITVSSGIRRGELNGLVGGVAHSDHLYNQFSAAADIIIGGYENRLTAKYLDQIFRICRRRKEYVKQFIYYFPYQENGKSRGNFLHLSTRDKTTKVWERLYCVSREGRRYFSTQTEAEEYLRSISG
jgi:hypothetical protein